MNRQYVSPQFSPELVGQVVVLEAEPGPARDAVIQQWLAESRHSGATTWLLRCAYEQGGIWAGIAELFQQLVPHIRERAPALLTKYSYELCLILPALRLDLPVGNLTLTETASEDEKVRNFAADRAYRSLHGLIDLLDAWHRLSDGVPWVIACDQYDQANGLVHRFFTELMRRRGQHLKLSLLIAVAPGTDQATGDQFDPSILAQAVRLDLPGATRAGANNERMTQMAHELEQQIEHDVIAQEVHLPRLIHYWEHSETPDKALRWQVKAIELYNLRGLYEAGIMYTSTVQANLGHLYSEDKKHHDKASDDVFTCYIALGEIERAQSLLTELFARTNNRVRLAVLYYKRAMLHTRHRELLDLDQAEEYLQRSLTLLSEADLANQERHFYMVFMWNGLALVRLRQGRPQEALDLCRAGIARLNEHLSPDQHRLYRSVLLYNIAQVHAQIGPHEKAVAYFTAALAMDPNYTEYYNERGNVYLQMGCLNEAERDYREAIKLSPPYAEVWTNLGQCYRAMDRMADAAAAYSKALDLDPTMRLALIGRAEANAALDHPQEALADYGAALALDPEQPLVLASRAIVYYETGNLLAALADLNQAVTLAPQTAELYYNRAVALRDLDRFHEAARELRTYLWLQPDANDRHQVEHMLSNL